MVTLDGWKERAYVDSDMETLIALEQASGPAAWSPDLLKKYCTKPDCIVRVVVAARRPEQPVAFYVLQQGLGQLYLANLSVDPSWRRRGVASFALERIREFARERGFKRIALDVQEDNLGAQLLYRKLGFHVSQIKHGHYGDQDGYRMVAEVGGE